MTGTYVYANGNPAAAAHHDHLSAMLDAHTTALLGRLRLHAARCMEIGAGAGSIACWLADKVGPHGHVLATDLDPMPIQQHPCLQVLRHDIVTQPVPAGRWDLIHARLVLVHLPQRREVLSKLAAALAPHGALVIEDWDMTWAASRVMSAPSTADAVLFERFQNTLWSVYTAAGVDRAWASRVPAAMIGAGLVDVSAQVHTQSWAGGSPAARLLAGNIAQLGDQLLDRGLTTDDLHRMRGLMANPNMIFRMPPMVSTLGFAPRPAIGSGAPAGVA